IAACKYRIGLVGRLGLEDIQRRSCDATFVERLHQSLLVDQPAPRHIDEKGLATHRGDRGSIDQMRRFGGLWQVNGYEICLTKRRMQVAFKGISLLSDLSRFNEWIIDEDPHSEGRSEGCYLASDPAVAQKQNCAPSELKSGKA